jgi:hypothetical protein
MFRLLRHIARVHRRDGQGDFIWSRAGTQHTNLLDQS